MIIPIRCFTCSTVLADKYKFYLEEVKKRKKEDTPYFNASNTEKTVEGIVMDELHLTKPCCRRHFLTHVDIE